MSHEFAETSFPVCVSVRCPETHKLEVVELSGPEFKEVSWCSRTLNKPGCSADCLGCSSRPSDNLTLFKRNG